MFTNIESYFNYTTLKKALNYDCPKLSH